IRGILPPKSEVVANLGMYVTDSPNKVFVGGLPTDMTREEMQTWLQAYGELKALHL
ncbi:hypothetical protein KIPB_017265, partial [Kipferlia bialata]